MDFGGIITAMKNLMRLLKISLVILTIVVCIAIVQGLISDTVKNAVTSGNNANTSSTQESTTAMNELPTVAHVATEPAQTVADSSGMRVDYKPLSGSGKIVEETIAADSGAVHTYDFEEEFYPYRAMLNENQQKVYDQIYEAVDQRADKVALCRQLNSNSIEDIMTAIYNDHPEFFWLETAYSYGYTNKGVVIYVTLSYNATAETMQTSRTAFLNAASSIINEASQYASDLEKERSVYMQLQRLAAYNENADINQSAYSALVNQSSVCAGYARAFQYIMQKLNIPCYFCSGYANGGNHAWNIVCIDGEYYNVDISWDDTLGEQINEISYTYFNLSDRTFELDHQRSGLSMNLPKCSG